MALKVAHIICFAVVFAFVLCASPRVLAQLNQNRTVQVNADGSWVLPNIPANFGQVKARATCVQNGITTFGESAFFTIPANGSVNLPHIILGNSNPIPVSLAISPANPSFAAAGQTVQLTVTATYPDGSTRNVGAASTGTNYTTSNAAIASITANGLITAVASGTVVIQATNDGASGILSVPIVLAGDSVGGIPVSWIIANHLNQYSPTLAFEDPDRDGLTNLQEFQTGTDPNNSDTDGDGLLDGDEVNVYHTSPLLGDTDGDGLWDGLEVATGSDPLNSRSYNLARALSRIEVTPASFVLTVNSIVLQAFQDLTVTGFMTDGRRLDLTAKPLPAPDPITSLGTNYTSSDLNVCNFGSPVGRVFAGTDGPCTITVTNSGFTAQSQGTVRSFTATPLSVIHIPGFANNVDVSGNYAYVAAGGAGLQIVNVTNRTAPVIVGSMAVPGNANDVEILGNLAFIAAGPSGLQIVDVSNPASPVIIGAYDTHGYAWAVVVRDNKAYVANGDPGVQIIDVSRPTAPRTLGSIDPPGTQKGIDVDPVRQIAVLASGASGIQVIDVSNPSSPAQIGAVSYGGDARDLALKGNFAIVADYQNSMTSIDLSDPRNPVVRASTPLNLGGRLNDVKVKGDFALGADVFFVNGVPLVNINNPANPIPRAILNFANLGDADGQGIAADSSYVYLAADGGSAFIENGTSGSAQLYIGQYLSREDRFGIAPVVQITGPAQGNTFVEGESIPIRVSATDDVAVASVDFLVNGQVVFTTGTEPYQFNFTAPVGARSLTLSARALDFGNNLGNAANVLVNVIPDPLTTASGIVVNGTGNAVIGATVSCLGHTLTSGANGSFSVSGLPTVQGNISCAAAFTSQDGTPLAGVSASKTPVRGGITDVGTIVVVAAAFEQNIGTLVSQCDDCVPQANLPFSFHFYGHDYTRMFVSNNGNIEFNFADGSYVESLSSLLGSQPRISPFWDDLIWDFTFGNRDSGLYFNDQLPGRFVVTWRKELEYFQVPGLTTVQAILYSDGRILFNYGDVSSLDAIVGISPGNLSVGNPLASAVDFTATPSFSMSAGQAVYEQFEVPNPRGSTDSPGGGQSSTRNNPFDLANGSILFTPNAAGGYDVRVIRPIGFVGNGTLTGYAYDANGQPLPGVDVEILSAYVPEFRIVTRTDSRGWYRFAGVPRGGMLMVRAINNGATLAYGTAEYEYDSAGDYGGIRIDLYPTPQGPVKQ